MYNLHAAYKTKTKRIDYFLRNLGEMYLRNYFLYFDLSFEIVEF